MSKIVNFIVCSSALFNSDDKSNYNNLFSVIEISLDK